MIDKKNTNIAIIGLGYVGLPLAVEFGKFFNTIGFDINKSRVNELISGKDRTLEVETKDLKLSLNSKTHLLHHHLCNTICSFYKMNL